MDLSEELRQLFASARKAASQSREQARDMRTAMKISRKIAKAGMRLKKAANRDENKVKPGELDGIRKDLTVRLDEISEMINDIRRLDFMGRDEIVTRLDLASYQMNEEFTQNWPEFERLVKEHA